MKTRLRDKLIKPLEKVSNLPFKRVFLEVSPFGEGKGFFDLSLVQN